MVMILDVSNRKDLLEYLNDQHYNEMFSILSQYIMLNNDALKLEDKSLTLEKVSYGLLRGLDIYDAYVTDLGDGSLHFWLEVNADIELYEHYSGNLTELINVDMSVECYSRNSQLDNITIFQILM